CSLSLVSRCSSSCNGGEHEDLDPSVSQYVCMCLSRGQRSELTNHLEESKGRRRREQVTEFVKCVGGVVCGVRVCVFVSEDGEERNAMHSSAHYACCPQYCVRGDVVKSCKKAHVH